MAFFLPLYTNFSLSSRDFSFSFFLSMEGIMEESDTKSHLVNEICNMWNGAINCAHLHPGNSVKSPFMDWYLLLGVKVNAGTDEIRKQYYKLALQLHPDKNKHAKAEIAFKLVSEAYACLSDDARRVAFDWERQNSLCIQCSRIPSKSHNPCSNERAKNREFCKPEKLKSNRIQLHMREIGARIKEEARVMENCLKTNAATRKDYPIFNPSNYSSHDYPHHRTRYFTTMKRFSCLQKENKGMQEQCRCDLPIFDTRTQRASVNFRSPVYQFVI